MIYKMKKKIERMAWTMTFGIAYSLFAISLLFFVWQMLFIQTAKKTTGKVVDMDTQVKIRSHDLHAPVIEFKTEDNKVITFHTKVFEYPPTHKRGEEVVVLYHPSHPENAKVQHFRHLWFWTSLMVGIGLLFVIVGFLSPNARGF